MSQKNAPIVNPATLEKWIGMDATMKAHITFVTIAKEILMNLTKNEYQI